VRLRHQTAGEVHDLAIYTVEQQFALTSAP
jgi:hypothetical protein